MSPVSTALPAPTLEIASAGQTPWMGTNDRVGVGVLSFGEWGIRPGMGPHYSPYSSVTLTAYGNESSGGTFFDMLDGRPCINNASGPIAGPLATDAGRWTWPTWRPVWSSAGMAPGAKVLPDSVVGVWDFSFRLPSAGPVSWVASDVIGLRFLPHHQLVTTACTPGNPGGPPQPAGGFGLFANTVAGAAAWEYVSWDPSYTILERITFTGITVTEWNTWRFQIIGADSTRDAQLEVLLNSESQFFRTFGSATLLTPDQMCASLTPARCDTLFIGGRVTGGPWAYHGEAQFSRFTPAGREVQGR